MKPSPRKTSLSQSFAVALLGAVLVGCGPSGGKRSPHETAPVVRGRLVQDVTASGTLGAVISVDVGSQVSGKVSALHADFNSPVKKGQLVAEIDPTIYEASLRQAEGEVASAEATRTLRAQNLERKKALLPLKAASETEVEQAVAELAQAEAAVVIRKASRDSARANLGYCKITAPVDGIVISRKVDLGQTVIAAMNTPVLFTIAQDIAKMNISASVSEADIGQVRTGQAVEFTVDAFPDEVFRGAVSQVRKAPVTTQNVVTYETIIAVENPGQKLFPGMTADVAIRVAERVDIPKLPNSAMRYSPPEGTRFEDNRPAKLQRNQRLVYVPAADRIGLKPVAVRIGITDGVETEVLEGLSEGATVVTSTLVGPAAGNGVIPPTPPQEP